MITEYKFSEPNSPHAKINFDCFKHLIFHQYALGSKSTRDVNVLRFRDNKRRLLASGISFPSGNSIDFFDKLRMILQKEDDGIDSDNFDEKVVALLDELLEY